MPRKGSTTTIKRITKTVATSRQPVPSKLPKIPKAPQPKFKNAGTLYGTASHIIMTPGHGVSGYATTGVAGDFDFQSHRPIHEVTPNVDSSTSGFGIQAHGTSREVRSGLARFNATTTPAPRNIVTPSPNTNANYNEPTFEADAQRSVRTSSLGLSRDLQSLLDPQQESFLRRRLFEGAFSDDPIVQRMLVDQEEGAQIREGIYMPSHTSTGRPHLPPNTATRHGHEHVGNGTQNATYQIIANTPTGQSENPSFAEQNTPTLVNTSNFTPAAHHSIGNGFSSGHTQGSSAMQVAATIVPINPTPYTTLGVPPQPQVQYQEGPGILMPVVPEASRPSTNKFRPLQFSL